jgi:hypothetical protein
MSNPDYNDIVYRLRNPTYWFFQTVGPRSGASVHGESDAPRDAADEIERLRAELAAERERKKSYMQGEITEYERAEKAEKRVSTLREALKPFSKECDRLGAQFVTPETVMRPTIEAGELSRARAVYQETGGDNGNG